MNKRTRLMTMDVRAVDTETRTVEGVCVPYGETSFLTPNADGERIIAGAFAKSIRQRGDKILMYREHGHVNDEDPIGKALAFEDSPAQLLGRFHVRESVEGERALVDMREGYLPQLSVGFVPLQTRTAGDGVLEITEARLAEVSAVAIGAYEGADILAVRAMVTDPMAAFGKIPDVNLSPIPRTWDYARR